MEVDLLAGDPPLGPGGVEEASEGCGAEAGVDATVVVLLEPRGEGSVEGFDRDQGTRLEGREEPSAEGAEEALDLAPPLGLVGRGVGERHAEASTGQGEVVGGEGRSVVAVQAQRQAVAAEGFDETADEVSVGL